MGRWGRPQGLSRIYQHSGVSRGTQQARAPLLAPETEKKKEKKKEKEMKKGGKKKKRGNKEKTLNSSIEYR